ncbi:CYTOSOL-AP domain-containing protein [Aphelenchoides bicaudatus]|nr:CYTOSOL-AP domain-containing protein [Aphelenchoides bicaudatus]
MSHNGLVEISLSSSVNDEMYDALVVISESVSAVRDNEKLRHLVEQIDQYVTIHKGLDSGRATVLFHSNLPSKRLIYSSTGSTNGDFDDVRHFLEAGKAGMKSALEAGVKFPLLAIVPSERFPNAQLSAALGALHQLYVPYNIRSEVPERAKKIERIGILSIANTNSGRLLRQLDAFQSSFIVTRDIGDTDPQRMAPPRMAEYAEQHFKGTSVKVIVESNQELIKKEYPLLSAVNRSANDVKEHQARVIWLEYENKEAPPEGKQFQTIMLVGKGVTIDTGGADLKTGGSMQGMCRDKYGAAVVAGFFDALDKLRPKGIKVVGVLCAVRNSIGSNAYTCDEIITSRSNKRIFIGNTDAEGRLAMLDPLTSMREKALKETDPHLYTLATLTGHEVLSYGMFPAVMDNGPAAKAGHAKLLQQVGDVYGQPVEISRLHIEDFRFNKSLTEAADLRQAINRPSVQTLRGHQSPAAFLIQASRLDEHGVLSPHPIKFSHIDIGSAMGDYPQVSFPSPLLALVALHILPRSE